MKKNKRTLPKRESPNDFWLAFLAWRKKNPLRRVTAKGFAIIRAAEQVKK